MANKNRRKNKRGGGRPRGDHAAAAGGRPGVGCNGNAPPSPSAVPPRTGAMTPPKTKNQATTTSPSSEKRPTFGPPRPPPPSPSHPSYAAFQSAFRSSSASSASSSSLSLSSASFEYDDDELLRRASRNDSGGDESDSDGSYSIPPLAKRDESSSSSGSSSRSSLAGGPDDDGDGDDGDDGDDDDDDDDDNYNEVHLATMPAPPRGGGVPGTIRCDASFSSSGGASDDDESISEIRRDYAEVDVGSVASDDSGDGMPALVQRDESSQSSNESDESMPKLVNRASGKQQQRQRQQRQQQQKQQPSAPTPSPNTKMKKKRKRKKKKGGNKEADNNEPPAVSTKSAADMSTVRELLKKFRMYDQDEAVVYDALTKSGGNLGGFVTGSQRMERQFLLELAHGNLRRLAAFVGANASRIPRPVFVAKADKAPAVGDVLNMLFHFVGDAGMEPLWTLLDDAVTSPILLAALSCSVESLKWFEQNASDALEAFSRETVRQEDVNVLLDAGVRVSCKSVAALFANLPQGRGHQFNNKVARILCEKSTIFMQTQSDYKLVMDAVSETVGKAGKLSVNFQLKQASATMHKLKHKQRGTPEKASNGTFAGSKNDAPPLTSKEQAKAKKAQEEAEKKLAALKLKTHKIKSALKWYNNLLDELNAAAASTLEIMDYDEHGKDEKKCEDGILEESTGSNVLVDKPRQHVLTSEQVVEALANCDSEERLAEVETGVDLFQWDGMSEWTIECTEQAHKWFRRHIKKDRGLCERIIRRLTLLSTGRWPYVLCKRLKLKQLGNNGKKISLYETKIDSASRIIWEVAIAFSPRRSRLQNYCEQVIRVWDIVLDHDNLSRTIAQTTERIEKSHLRGEECAIYAEIEKFKDAGSDPPTKERTGESAGVTRIPRVFSMKSEVTCVGSARDRTSKGRSRHFHPASDDPRQYTLLKFYELNAGAVKMLLDGQDESMDLPFTPGPKEHEIIHYQSDPQRSILLMGRSGTGKTTCLVFRMWAQYTQYIDGQHGARPRQLFLTKNEVLCREVERSFNNMGLAWRRRNDPSTSTPTEVTVDERPKFLISSEWLDALDVELPGEPFFTKHELKQRFNNRRDKDSLTKGIEALLSDENADESTASTFRQEMTFTVFRRLWKKIRSGSRSQMDCVIVWREIKSFIKGSVAAVRIEREERSLPQNRFLSLGEYLDLPRKQSRMDEVQRREVYDLFLSYEKLKKEGSYYDECDLVYNIAGRISVLDQSSLGRMAAGGSTLLPIDSLFVDEVQDFTQSELYILAKLCRDPNNLFLAGDTAQSIAVGVDFRFTDVRQIFYNSFGGIEPKLLQLSHNYRSHAGVLRLAACVVELLYHFFGNSLDKLPPDLGLFDGPKPVVMDVASTQELVLMLQGAKRETSRIEFGAHQVVIVRSEAAKKSLPDEFGIDPDWVMTVQESKGLEFDDVLMYNFFSDSPAEDLWRVVSSYTEEDIAAYYSDATVAASGVQKYDWENPLLTETRSLDFNADMHKILEPELKMLYTAITRARVNIFIAETNTESSRPMFNYFQRRSVVDVVSKENSEEEGLSGVRVFGAMNTVEDWRNRGEYYLRNAEGERQIGCLRLAAKCFDKAGEPQRRDYALAFLSFTEIEEQDLAKPKGKQGVELKQRLYNITEQLLEARDVGFLNKAALCLLRTGEQEEYTAQLFELYARLCYTQRICEERGNIMLPLPPAQHEKKYFSYAAKLFAKCSQQRGIKFDLSSDAFRNFVCAGMYEDAAELINCGILPIQDSQSFQEVYKLCIPSSLMDPAASFRKDFKRRADKCQCVLTAMKRVASRL